MLTFTTYNTLNKLEKLLTIHNQKKKLKCKIILMIKHINDKIYDSESDKYLQLSSIILGGEDRDVNILKCYKKLYHSIKIRARNFINNRYKII